MTGVQAVVIGASAGAVEALSQILPALPTGYPLPVITVVHVPPDRESALVGLLGAKCKVEVVEAEDKAPIQAGTIYFAPPDYHLLVEPDGYLSLSSEEPVKFSRPSIDVLFESAADVYGPGLLGIVLSGANNDGAEGLRAVAAAGGAAVVQDPASAQAPSMPEAALCAVPDALSLTLDEIAQLLLEAAGR